MWVPGENEDKITIVNAVEPWLSAEGLAAGAVLVYSSQEQEGIERALGNSWQESDAFGVWQPCLRLVNRIEKEYSSRFKPALRFEFRAWAADHGLLDYFRAIPSEQGFRQLKSVIRELYTA